MMVFGSQTDEEKLGVTYKQIEEMIEKGDTEKEAKIKILELSKKTLHKRKPTPIYTFERKNYLSELGD